MAIELVQFEDKQNINEKPELPRINKVIDADINELKDVANTNANNVGNLENLNTTDKESLVEAINSSNHLIKDFIVELDTDETNIILLPNGITSYSVSRIAGLENNNGSINSLFNTNTQSLYLGRVYLGINYSLDSLLLLNEEFAKNISQYGTPGTDGSCCFGNLSGVVNIENSPITSLIIKINNGQITAGTNIKIYQL